MKIARLFGVALMAIVALSAMLASTASAVPTFKLPITLRGFVGLSGLSILRTPSEVDTVDCASAQAPGTILNDDSIDVKIHYLNCFLYQGVEAKKCTIKSLGSAAGLVLTELLLGLLGTLDKQGGAAGILFEPKTGGVFVRFAPTESPCSTVTTAVEGSVIGLLSPTGKLSATALISVAPVSATSSIQEATEILVLSGLVTTKLSAFGAAKSTQEQDSLVEFEEPVEVS